MTVNCLYFVKMARKKVLHKLSLSMLSFQKTTFLFRKIYRKSLPCSLYGLLQLNASYKLWAWLEKKIDSQSNGRRELSSEARVMFSEEPEDHTIPLPPPPPPMLFGQEFYCWWWYRQRNIFVFNCLSQNILICTNVSNK